MKTTAAGIDYSTGFENRNLETGIHYGVINQNECLQAWADSGRPEVIVTRFASGEEIFQNRRGRCEDAPCCGCCS